MTSWLIKALPCQFWVIWQKRFALLGSRGYPDAKRLPINSEGRQ